LTDGGMGDFKLSCNFGHRLFALLVQEVNQGEPAHFKVDSQRFICSGDVSHEAIADAFQARAQNQFAGVLIKSQKSPKNVLTYVSPYISYSTIKPFLRKSQEKLEKMMK